MTPEEKYKMHKVIQILKNKTEDWGVIGEAVTTAEKTDRALAILENNPQISIAEFMEKMGITGEDEEI